MATDQVASSAAPKVIDKPLMRDYWAKYRARTYIVVTSAQCSFVIVALGALELLGVTKLNWLGFAGVTVVLAALLIAVTVSLVHILGRPFRDLVQAIVLVAGEPSAATPPNPNRYGYNQDGFKEILQTVYEMAARNDMPSNEPAVDNTLTTGLDNSRTGIVIMDENQRIVYHNSHAPIAYDTDNNPVLEAIFPDDDSLTTWLTKAGRNKVTDEHNWVRIANRLPGDKDRRLFDVAASYHKNSKAETVLTFFDQTENYMPEEDELDFISFAAHELRGPITVIRGYLDVLHEELTPSLQNDQSELMERLIVASNRLDSYVNNILNASRYDRRHLKLHLSEDTVRHIYDQISDDMQMRAKAQSRVLVVDIPEVLPTVAADTNAVGEVMANLIDNAIKYSNEGGLVHVTARAVQGFVEISIADRGIGMPANVLPNLFHKFYRSHRSRETVAGTGIGLYICKAIISSHGGEIDVRSIENEGSTFSFTLPIYDTVAEKIKAGDNSNIALIEHGHGWIRNHSMIKG
jgi:signal transduction histidine kinase